MGLNFAGITFCVLPRPRNLEISRGDLNSWMAYFQIFRVDLISRMGNSIFFDYLNFASMGSNLTFSFFLLIRTNLIRTPRLRFAIGQRAKSKTNKSCRKLNVKNDRGSSKMHFKGIIWGGVREKFEISVKKNKNNRGSARFIWFLLKNKSVFLRLTHPFLYFITKYLLFVILVENPPYTATYLVDDPLASERRKREKAICDSPLSFL